MKALSKLSTHIKSYVVWDEQVRDTLVVAFTIAGIENAIVVTPGTCSSPGENLISIFESDQESDEESEERKLKGEYCGEIKKKERGRKNNGTTTKKGKKRRIC